MEDCQFRTCESDAFRHFFGFRFCDYHNMVVREEAAQSEPDDLEAWIDEFTE